MAVHRDEVVAAAIRMLNHDPGASMAELAAAAGISRASLHRLFASREDLLAELGRRALDGWEAGQDAADIDAAAASGDPARIERALEALLVGFVEDADEQGYVLTDHLMARVEELAARSDRLEEREVAFYAAAQAAGVLRADLPARWISSTVYGLLIALRECDRDGALARADSARAVIETFLYGTARSRTRKS